ncbi:MAG TPA: hypothetical protein VI980_04740 [Acidimicrobiia bacterium]|nr:hypothetical protein [Acidimicrobiia bacterium]
MTAIEMDTVTTPKVTAPRTTLVLLISGILAMVVGFGAMAGGLFGVWYTWDQAVAQDVVTPDDAAIAETAMRGPFTMWAEADIINTHQLENTGGLYYAQMDRMVPQVDESGAAVLDANGDPVLVPNEVRASWVTATTLITALGLGILSYTVSGLAIAVGFALMVTGFVFLYLRKRAIIL